MSRNEPPMLGDEALAAFYEPEIEEHDGEDEVIEVPEPEPPPAPKAPLPVSPRLPTAPAREDDRLTQMVRQLSSLNTKLERIAQALEKAADRPEVPWMASPPVGQFPTPVEPGRVTFPSNTVNVPPNVGPPGPPPPWICPQHATPPKWVPPGTSRQTQKPYPGFWACSTSGCRERVTIR